MIFDKRPITIQVHPNLIDELKLRRESIIKETGRKTWGGLTAYSEQAAEELKLIRLEGEKITKELFKYFNLKKLPISKFEEYGVLKDFVPYELFKKLYLYASVISKKKDKQQLHIEVAKIKGMQKDEIKFF